MEKGQEIIIQQTIEDNFPELNKDLSLHTKNPLSTTQVRLKKTRQSMKRNISEASKEKQIYVQEEEWNCETSDVQH